MYFTGLTLCSLHDYFALLFVRRWYLWFRPLHNIQVYNSSRVLVLPPYQRGDINFTYSTICSTSHSNLVMCFLSSIYRTPSRGPHCTFGSFVDGICFWFAGYYVSHSAPLVHIQPPFSRLDCSVLQSATGTHSILMNYASCRFLLLFLFLFLFLFVCLFVCLFLVPDCPDLQGLSGHALLWQDTFPSFSHWVFSGFSYQAVTHQISTSP